MEAVSSPFGDTEFGTFRGFRTLLDNLPLPYQGLYGIYCVVNGKWYIGISKNLQKRAYKHAENDEADRKFRNAIRKHGVGNFIFIPLCYAPNADRDWLHEKETENILRYDSIKNGYNVVLMGAGPVYGEEHTATIRAAHARPEVKAKVISANQRITSDPAVQAKLSVSVRAAYEDPAVHDKISEKVAASWQDPIVRQKQLASRGTPKARERARATFYSPAAVVKRNAKRATQEWRDASNGWFHTPEANAKRNAAIRDPEVQRKKAIKQSAHYDKPGVREAHAEKIRAAHQRRREKLATDYAAMVNDVAAD